MRGIFLFVLIAAVAGADAADIDVKSRFNAEQTVERFVHSLKDAGIDVVEQSNHQNRVLGNSETVILFNNPYYGTSIGSCHKGERKDKPLQARVWTDGDGKAHLEYEQPDPIINRYGVIECGNETEKLRVTLGSFAFSATE